MDILNGVKKFLGWFAKGGPFDGIKRQLGLILLVLENYYPVLKGINVLDGISNGELLTLWGFIDAELRKRGAFVWLIQRLAKLLSKLN